MPQSRVLAPAESVPAASVEGATAAVRVRPSTNLRRHRQTLTPVFTALAVTVLVVISISFARSVGLVAPLWGAAGLAVVVWLRTSTGRMYDLSFGAMIAVGLAAGNFLVGNETLHTAMFTLANMLDIVMAVLMARRFAPTLNLATVTGAWRFLLGAALIAPIPSALFATGALYLLDGTNPLLSAQTWWFGHALSIAIIGSFGLSLTKRELVRLRSPAVALEAVVLMTLLTVGAWVVFVHLDVQLSFLILPILLLIAVRLRMLGVTAALLIVTVLAVGGSMTGHGPFTGDFGRADQALMGQLLVMLGYLPVMLVAALLEERDRLSDRAKLGQVRAEKASAAKSRLLANVAHEIKSPVGGIIGIGDLWQGGQLGPVNDTQVEMAAMLVKTARQVEMLAHDLLDVARAESGEVSVELRPTDVPGVLEDVRRATALRPEAGELTLEVITEGDGLVALADSQRLNQVITNLASNAVKYGASGGVITFRACRVHDAVRVEVSDQGPGLTPEKQAQLFEPFNRLGLDRSTIEGHGIGLALAKRLVELQGGTIGVVSQPGEGATFWIELPAA